MFASIKCIRKLKSLSHISFKEISSFQNKILKCNGKQNFEGKHFPFKIIGNKDSHIFQLFSTSSTFYKKKRKNILQNEDENLQENDKELEVLEDEKYDFFTIKASGDIMGVSSFAVLQPWVKWGARKRRDTTAQLMLDEACALVLSLPSVTIAYKESVPLQSISKVHIFGTGSLERLVLEIGSSNAQAVFLSIDHLSRVQRRTLEDLFKLRVYDRYIMVLTIFKHYAKSTEARLQIAMAELPFMNKFVITEKDKLVLDYRESRLKDAIKRLAARREKVRKNRMKSSISSVAIVGYTNCGKTTLIRRLTGDERAEGKNRLFATLDVTAHKGPLPCGLNVLFIDTVGFIQDIPTGLIASFNATLQDAINADVVVHVRDISHPDIVVQTKTVLETLKNLPLHESTPVVVVNNKMDLLEERLQSNPEMRNIPVYQEGHYISAVSGEGINKMIHLVEKELLQATGRKRYIMKLPTGSSKLEWLKQFVGVSKEDVNEVNPQNTDVQVVMNEAEKAAFRRAFSS